MQNAAIPIPNRTPEMRRIHKVTLDLVDDFNAVVLGSSGADLCGGNAGKPHLLCSFMSQNDNAQKLCERADEGTIVKIVSNEFQPQSDLGKITISQTLNRS